MEEASNGVRAAVVDQANLPAVWDEVSELLALACERSHGQETIQTLRASLMKGSEGLFVVQDGDDIIGAVTYQTTDYNTGLRLLDINYAGGVAMDTQMPAVIEMFHRLKTALMCDRLRITGRKGWVRYMKQFGFVDTHYSVEME
jgi:hypothetical protein